MQHEATLHMQPHLHSPAIIPLPGVDGVEHSPFLFGHEALDVGETVAVDVARVELADAGGLVERWHDVGGLRGPYGVSTSVLDRV